MDIRKFMSYPRMRVSMTEQPGCPIQSGMTNVNLASMTNP